MDAAMEVCRSEFGHTTKPLPCRQENDVLYCNHEMEPINAGSRSTLPNDPQGLLEYYRNQVAAFNRERQDYLSKLDDCSVSRKDYYKLRWEISQRDMEVAELQKALSDAHIYLYDEREHVVRLHAENDELKVQELEDRKRIQHLLALTQPVTQEVTYFRDCRPHSITRATVPLTSAATTTTQRPTSASMSYSGRECCPTVSRSTPSTVARRNVTWTPSRLAGQRDVFVSGEAAGAGLLGREFLPPTHIPRALSEATVARVTNVATAKTRDVGNGQTETHSDRVIDDSECSIAPITHCKCISCGKRTNVIRTIYLPNENADSLRLIIESLRNQLAEQMNLASNQKSAFVEDRGIREQETALRAQSALEKHTGLEEQLRKQQEIHHRTTKDYFQLRYEFRTEEERWRIQNDQLRVGGQQLQQELSALAVSSRKDTESVKKHAEQETREYVQQYRSQVLDREENVCMYREQYAVAQKMYEARLRHLEEKHESLLQKYKTLDRRRRLEIEGFSSEIVLVRKSVKNLARNMQLVRLASRHSADQEKLATAPEFTALEDRLIRIAKQLQVWSELQESNGSC